MSSSMRGPLEADVMRVVRAARLACRFGSGCGI
jgi:hypothetical protein